mmetsp:Transcript_3123/g.11292  ORF Transcript_3123/g.11292 Transcript_3123/m.11292 type:complete len:230 (-) Transcript_3123:25-714(-)
MKRIPLVDLRRSITSPTNKPPSNSPPYNIMKVQLELHHVRLVTRSQGEQRGQVLLHVRRGADRRGQSRINRLVVRNVRSRKFLLGRINLEELLFALARAVLCWLLEVRVIKLLGVNLGHVNLFRRRDDVTLVHTLDRHTVHPVRTGNEQQTRGKLLDEHHALTLEVTRQQDQHLTRSDGRAKLGLLVLNRALKRLLDIVRRVEGRRLSLLRFSHGWLCPLSAVERGVRP